MTCKISKQILKMRDSIAGDDSTQTITEGGYNEQQ